MSKTNSKKDQRLKTNKTGKTAPKHDEGDEVLSIASETKDEAAMAAGEASKEEGRSVKSQALSEISKDEPAMATGEASKEDGRSVKSQALSEMSKDEPALATGEASKEEGRSVKSQALSEVSKGGRVESRQETPRSAKSARFPRSSKPKDEVKSPTDDNIIEDHKNRRLGEGGTSETGNTTSSHVDTKPDEAPPHGENSLNKDNLDVEEEYSTMKQSSQGCVDMITETDTTLRAQIVNIQGMSNYDLFTDAKQHASVTNEVNKINRLLMATEKYVNDDFNGVLTQLRETLKKFVAMIDQKLKEEVKEYEGRAKIG